MDNIRQFQSQWFERCVRDYLHLRDNEPITQEALTVIKYLSVGTTHDYLLAFGKEDLPNGFYFEDAGDEWECCCVSHPGKYHKLEDFIEVIDWTHNRKILTLKEEISETIEAEMDAWKPADKLEMKKFYSSVKYYYAEEKDFEGLNEDEQTCDWGILVPQDFAHLTGLKAIRFMDCETEIHNLAFLRELPNLKVLELGEIRLETMDGTEKFSELDMLCIWPVFSPVVPI